MAYRILTALWMSVAAVLGLHTTANVTFVQGKTVATHIQTAANGGAQSATKAPIDSNTVTVNTPDWICIRFNESTNGELSSNIYQIQGDETLKQLGVTEEEVNTDSRAVQNGLALRLYAYGEKTWHEGFHAWLADWKVCHLGRNS